MRSSIRVATILGLLVAPGAFAASNYDGTYKGESTVTRGDASICGKSPLPIVKQVVNGQFSLVYDLAHNVGVNLAVQPDGSFSGNQVYQVNKQQAQVRASGRISGNALEAQIEGLACSRSYHLTKG